MPRKFNRHVARLGGHCSWSSAVLVPCPALVASWTIPRRCQRHRELYPANRRGLEFAVRLAMRTRFAFRGRSLMRGLEGTARARFALLGGRRTFLQLFETSG